MKSAVTRYPSPQNSAHHRSRPPAPLENLEIGGSEAPLSDLSLDTYTTSTRRHIIASDLSVQSVTPYTMLRSKNMEYECYCRFAEHVQKETSRANLVRCRTRSSAPERFWHALPLKLLNGAGKCSKKLWTICLQGPRKVATRSVVCGKQVGLCFCLGGTHEKERREKGHQILIFTVRMVKGVFHSSCRHQGGGDCHEQG